MLSQRSSAGTVLVFAADAAPAPERAALRDAGLRVVETPDAAAAIACVEEARADLHLVEGSGPEAEDVLRRLAADRAHTHVPVVVLAREPLTAVGARRLFGSGAADVWLPPHNTLLVVARAEALIRLKRQVDAARELSVRDELTGLYTRRFFVERLDQEAARAQRTGQGLALLLVDVDRFKRINDSLGHTTGDAVLQAIARVAIRHTRKSDLAARIGGDELALLLAANTADGARVCAEGLRRRLAQVRFDLPGGLRPTVSIGVAAWPSPAVREPLSDLVRVADEALLRAKHLGRDRVVVAGSSPPAPRGDLAALPA